MHVSQDYFRLGGQVRLSDELTFQLGPEWPHLQFFSHKNDSKREEKKALRIFTGAGPVTKC